MSRVRDDTRSFLGTTMPLGVRVLTAVLLAGPAVETVHLTTPSTWRRGSTKSSTTAS